MSETESRRDSIAESSADASFEATRRRQILLGLELTPAQRLEWLEEMLSLVVAQRRER